jgi:hypothetical protein
VNKETLIKAIEQELEWLKNYDGASIAGRSFGFGILESTDTDTTWYSRRNVKELHTILNDETYYKGE